MAALKDFYNEQSIREIAREVKRAYPKFDAKSFAADASKDLQQLEMKDRSKQIAAALKSHLPEDVPSALQVLVRSLALEGSKKGLQGFLVWPLTHFVEIYALEHFSEAMDALKEMTSRFTAEFAVRPFIAAENKKTLQLLKEWAKHKNEHVRRLTSEGTRPFLPWGMRLKQVAANPRLTFPILDLLKFDDSEYVRRSVANHLNDFAKVDSAFVVDTLKRWRQQAKSEEQKKKIEKIAKHACRTLLKQGHTDALALFGYGDDGSFKVKDLKLGATQVREGDQLPFRFTLQRAKSANSDTKAMVDYAVHHTKSNGSSTAKVFKLTVKSLKAGEQTEIASNHSFKTITTRRYHSGKHAIEILVNGKSLGRADFDLVAQVTKGKAGKVVGSRPIPSRRASKASRSPEGERLSHQPTRAKKARR